MRPISFEDLMNWVRSEYAQRGSAFGIRKEKFYLNKGGAGFSLFGKRLASPIGPAAGPHTQLAQNILAAYLAGSRFIELKTVQIMDGGELRKQISRPCISAVDEGYNVEWSTELTVEEALGEYVKGWFLCHVWAKEFGLAENSDVMFNMSVGYSLEGIQSEKIDAYIEGMKHAENTEAWKRCYQYVADHIDAFERFTRKDLDALSGAVSPGVTLSTLHGCPREEIEKIAAHLLGKKGLHTFIKCNPTLLGYETARSILDEMGYGYIAFDDRHFREDLQFDDAVDMIRRLQNLAKEKNLSFGVKLTNTFPVDIKRMELPGSEMYMSGRSLFPLSIHAAEKIAAAFQGDLRISYSGGADFFNLAAILKTGIAPLTAATTILKPGGYERFKQLAELAEQVMRDGGEKKRIDVEALAALAGEAPEMDRYRKAYRQTGLRKTGSDLPLLDCAKAPCMDGGCPINQRIPRYLEKAAAGDLRGAFDIIVLDNTAPSITGTICDHQCQNKCTRVDYDDPLEIRRAKKTAAGYAQESYVTGLKAPKLATDKSAAVIGAGPAGIAAAVFLRRNGVAVTVYEKREKPYGIVRYVIPAFRIADADIDRDYRIAAGLGVEFRFGADENYSIESLKKKHHFVVIASGAWKEGASPVKTGGEHIIDALKFLEDSKKSGCTLDLGEKVAVIGGGDVAMDCARAAKWNAGVRKVRIVYRRTREFMPSQYEEQEMALAEGVVFDELLAPLSFQNGILACERMKLGDYDQSGRRGVTGTGQRVEMEFDTVIGAVGARVDTEHFTRNGIALNEQGYPQTSDANESSIPGVYIAGDCRAGAATVVKAIADGKKIAEDILRKLGLQADFSAGSAPCSPAALSAGKEEKLYAKKGVLVSARIGSTDGARCLSCAEICEICVDVCPNRANVLVLAESACGSSPAHQVVHIDRMCNECGNCAIFCPHGGMPYRDKFTVFKTGEDFAESENPGFLPEGEGCFRLRLADTSVISWKTGEAGIPDNYARLIEALTKNHAYVL
jgi:putative selenate reductase